MNNICEQAGHNPMDKLVETWSHLLHRLDQIAASALVSPTSSATSSHIYTTLTTHFSQPYSGKLTGLSKVGYPLLHNPYYYYYYFV